MDDSETRGFAPRCVKAESLGPEGSMIGYDEKKKRTKNMNLISSIFRARAPKNSATRILRILENMIGCKIKEKKI